MQNGINKDLRSRIKCNYIKKLKGSEYFLIWNASVDLTVTIDYDNIEAETKEEAERIAKEKAIEDIDYNNCDADINDADAFVWAKSD